MKTVKKLQIPCNKFPEKVVNMSTWNNHWDKSMKGIMAQIENQEIPPQKKKITENKT